MVLLLSISRTCFPNFQRPKLKVAFVPQVKLFLKSDEFLETLSAVEKDA